LNTPNIEPKTPALGGVTRWPIVQLLANGRELTIRGVAGKFPIFDRALRTRADADHFVGFNEMVGSRMAAVLAGSARLGDDGDEIAEIGVFEHARRANRRARRMNRASDIAAHDCRRPKKSRRDFIIQPGVDAKRLRRVVNHETISTLKELKRCARNGDATALR